MEIRKATMDDFDELFKLKMESKRESHGFNEKLKIKGFDDKYKKYLEKDLNSEWRVVFAAVEDGKIIGMILGKIFRSMYILGHERTGYISNLFIRKGFRNNGLGKKLYDVLIDWFKSKECVALSLEVYKENKQAINFYKKLGFEKHSVKMVKDI